MVGNVHEGAFWQLPSSRTLVSEAAVRLQKDEDPFSVRVLPRILWGVHPRGLDSMPTSHPSMVVMHHFLGSWKIRSPWDLLRWSVQKQLVLQLTHLLQRLYAPETRSQACCTAPRMSCRMYCFAAGVIFLTRAAKLLSNICGARTAAAQHLLRRLNACSTARPISMHSRCHAYRAEHQPAIMGSLTCSLLCRLWPVKLPAAQSMEEALPNDVKGPRLYPVSILWEPPFTMLVHLVGHGSLQVSPTWFD